MSSPDTQVNAFQAQLKALEQEIHQLSKIKTGVEDYFRQFLERIVASLGEGGGIWWIGGAEEMVCCCHVNLDAAGLTEQGAQYQLLMSALQKVQETSGPVVLPGRAGSNMYDGGLGEAGVNESPHTLLFVPIIPTEQVEAVLLLISPAEVDPRAVRGYLGFVVGLCEKAGGFLLRSRMDILIAQMSRADRVRQYMSALHSGLDPRRTCYALANYGQELLGVYRCSAGTYNSRGKFRMQSVSGLESVAVQSSFIKAISEIARQVCRNDKVLLVDNPDAARTATDDADDLLTAVRVYMLQASSTVLGVFPIKWDKRVVGAFVVEKAQDEPIDEAQRQQIDAMLMEAGSAMSNSLAHRGLPFSLLVRSLGAVRDKVYRASWTRRAIWAAVLAVVVVLPFLLTKQVKVIGTAELVPVEARIVYAEQEGVIETVSIPEDNKVIVGQLLARLDTRLIDSEIDRVNNEIVEVSLALGEETQKSGGSTFLAASYNSRLKALNAELVMYQLQRRQYEIKSPLDGVVITRQSVLRQLLSRPVNRGEPILEVVPEKSDWQLTVHVSEDAAGELLKAYDGLDHQAGETLRAKVILNAYPDMKFDTKVLSVARRAHVLSTGEQKYRNVVEVRVAEPEGFRDKVEPRQGMKGKVAIECGERSVFYAMTHEFVDFVRVSLF
jgi:multidrug efflux pump subunit AcrA (membrane-fusion protein)